ncbi:MAG: phosphoribosyltransferase family protein [Patescibacteria group bacterium]
MNDYPDLPILEPKDALQTISSSLLSRAQKLLASSLVAQSRSFTYSPSDSDQSFLVLDVTHFLNHRINTKLIMAIGEELAALATILQPDIILTAPSSGNIPAIATAIHLSPIPDVVYAPKGQPITIDNAYHAMSRSYTHGKSVDLTVAKDCLPAGARVLICDDFLDTGKTAIDLLQIVAQAQAIPVGFCYVIEKPFGGREKLKEAGFSDSQIISLLSIDSMRPGKLKLNGFDAWFSLVRQ